MVSYGVYEHANWNIPYNNAPQYTANNAQLSTPYMQHNYKNNYNYNHLYNQQGYQKWQYINNSRQQGARVLRGYSAPQKHQIRGGYPYYTSAQLTKPYTGTRTCFTPYQVAVLNYEFSICPFLSNERKTELAHLFRLSERTLEIWFTNKRSQHKRETKLQLLRQRKFLLEQARLSIVNSSSLGTIDVSSEFISSPDIIPQKQICNNEFDYTNGADNNLRQSNLQLVASHEQNGKVSCLKNIEIERLASETQPSLSTFNVADTNISNATLNEDPFDDALKTIQNEILNSLPAPDINLDYDFILRFLPKEKTSLTNSEGVPDDMCCTQNNEKEIPVNQYKQVRPTVDDFVNEYKQSVDEKLTESDCYTNDEQSNDSTLKEEISLKEPTIMYMGDEVSAQEFIPLNGSANVEASGYTLNESASFYKSHNSSVAEYFQTFTVEDHV